MLEFFSFARTSKLTKIRRSAVRDNRCFFKEARNSFCGLAVYLLKSKFRIEDKLRFP